MEGQIKMSMTEEERRRQIIANMKKSQESKDSGESYEYPSEKKQYPIPEWHEVEDKTYTIIHPVGEIPDMRSENWHAKYVYYSEVMTDKGGKLKVVWPLRTDEYGYPIPDKQGKPQMDRSFILYRVWEAITKGVDFTKLKDKVYYDGPGDYVDTDVFKQIVWNKTVKEQEWDKNNKHVYKNHFVGQCQVFMPVWIPGDEWCETNKHTKLLTPYKKITDAVDGRQFDNSNKGITFSLYQKIMAQGAYYNDMSWDIDIVIDRDKDRKQANDKFQILRASDPAVVKMVEDRIKVKPGSNPLSEDFVASLKHHDLDDEYGFMTNPTPIALLYNLLAETVREVDRVAKTDLFPEFQEMAEKMKEEFKAQLAEQNKTVSPVTTPAPSVESAPEHKTEHKTISRGTPKDKVADKVADKTEEKSTEVKLAELYPHWNELPENDKKLTVDNISGFDADGLPIVKNEADFADCECKYANGKVVKTHNQISKCPNCGASYESA